MGLMGKLNEGGIWSHLINIKALAKWKLLSFEGAENIGKTHKTTVKISRLQV